MTPTEALRWAWMMGSLFGAIRAFWILRQALITNWAVHQVRAGAGVDTLKLITKSDVWLHWFILIALGANAMAGATAIAGQSILALGCLIVGAILLVVLTEVKIRQLNHIFGQIKLRRLYTEDQGKPAAAPPPATE